MLIYTASFLVCAWDVAGAGEEFVGDFAAGEFEGFFEKFNPIGEIHG